MMVCLLHEHKGTMVDEQDVLRIDRGKALADAEVDSCGAGVHGFEPGAGEEVDMVIGRDPNAAGVILKDGEDERFLNTILGAEVVEFGSVIAEEAVLGGDP